MLNLKQLQHQPQQQMTILNNVDNASLNNNNINAAVPLLSTSSSSSSSSKKKMSFEDSATTINYNNNNANDDFGTHRVMVVLEKNPVSSHEENYLNLCEESTLKSNAQMSTKDVDKYEDSSVEEDNLCLLCNLQFNLLLNKRLTCKVCALSVCRNCSLFDDPDWICTVCDQQRWVYLLLFITLLLLHFDNK